MIHVRVPGTSANLGPGFDCFGLALGVYNDLYFEERKDGLSFDNIDPRFQNGENLAIRAYRKVLRTLGEKDCGLYLKIVGGVPVSRGLGSSASLIVGGLTAANYAHGNRLDSGMLLKLATEIEGHPDNVAPALFGGMTASYANGDNVISVACPVSDKIRYCVLVPDFELDTNRSRSVLPKQVSHRDAVFNLAHTALLMRGMEAGNSEILKLAVDDRIHQPYRWELIRDSETVRAAAMDCGAIACCISGAGPSILCLHCSDSFCADIENLLRDTKHKWEILDLRLDLKGATVEMI